MNVVAEKTKAGKSGKSWPELQAIYAAPTRELLVPLRPLVPEREFIGDYPKWLGSVERAAPELVEFSRKWGR
jgi:hypothetical protein